MSKERKKKRMPYTNWACYKACFQVLEEKGKLDKESIAEKLWPLLLTKHQLDEYRQNYNETGNPLYIWDAYCLCRHFDKPWPDYVVDTMDWIMEYFDRVAEGLLKNKNNQLNDCALHLGFELKDGGPNQFRQYEKKGLMKSILARVIHVLNENKEKSLDKAFEEVSDLFTDSYNEPIKPETIKKWYHEYKKS